MTNGIVFMGCADVGSGGMFTITVPAVITSYANRAGGTRTYNSDGNTSLPQSVEYYIKLSFYFASNGGVQLSFRESGSTHCSFYINQNGNMAAYRSTNVLLDSQYNPAAYPLGTWHVLEAYAKIDNSVGVMTLKIDGNTWINVSGQDTRVDAGGFETGVVDNIVVGVSNVAWTDLVIRDDAWPGTGALYLLPVDGDGPNTSWTASAGNRWDCVNEVPPSATDYIYTDGGTPGVKNDFTVTDLSFTPAAITGVGVQVQARLALAGSGKVRAYGAEGVDQLSGDDLTLSISLQWAHAYMETAPDGTAWTKAHVDALIAGVETRA